jgi:hypothetical protein
MQTDLPDTQPKIKSMGVPTETAEPVIEVVKASDVKNPWICLKCGAIMGSVHHEKVRQGLSISALILFRGAAMIHETLPVNFIFGKVYAGEFGCSRCGEVRKWLPTPETLLYLSEGRHVKPQHNHRNP